MDCRRIEKLGNSRFRSRFHLSQKDIDYINEKSLDTIRKHAEDFIAKREAWHIYRMMGSRFLYVDIPYSLHSMQLQPAVGNVSVNGIKYSQFRQLNLCKSFSNRVIGHLMSILISIFITGYHGKTTDFEVFMKLAG